MDKVQYIRNMAGADTSRFPSPDLWRGQTPLELLLDASRGRFFWQDFTDAPLTAPASPNLIGGLYTSYAAATGPRGDNDPDAVQGNIGSLLTNLSAQYNYVSLAVQPGGQSSGVGFVSLENTDTFLFESRIKWSTLTARGGAFGLAQGGCASSATSLLVNAALGSFDGDGTFLATSANFIGMAILPGVTSVTAGYKISNVNIPVAAGLAAPAGTLAADTWIKLGLSYNKGSDIIGFWVNGVMGASIRPSRISASAIPKTAMLVPVIVHKATEASASTYSVDWVRMVHVYA